MFSFFKKKSKIDQLRGKYEKLMKESFELSKTNRSESDMKYVEAQSVMTEIEKYSL